MGFTTQIFIFLFFPLSLLAFTVINKLAGLNNRFGGFLCKIRARELLIILVSFFFYAWANVGNAIQLLFYVLLVYLLARWIAYSVKQKHFIEIRKGDLSEEGIVRKRFYLCRIVCCIAVAAVLGVLLLYKYMGLFFAVFNRMFSAGVSVNSLVAPIGLSFITFSAISYLVDVYRGNAMTGSFIDCALYLSFFPKLISGPIVLWKDFQPQIGTFQRTLDQSVEGINRIIVGFAKKVILADTFGKCIALMGVTNIDWLTACASLFLYSLQLYYDFAGYSDIAIGLAKLFGLDFKDNFNFPYRSTSISEFWRRWHISLGAWFREYVYIPLGGNRKGRGRTLLNLAIVFLLTGLWHGAGVAYLLWGGINGAFVIVERLLKDKKFYQKTPSIIKWGITMLIVTLFWQLFRFEDVGKTVAFLKIALGITKCESVGYTWQYFLDAQILTFAALGILGATVCGAPQVQGVYKKVVATKAGYIVQQILLLLLFFVAILFMVSSTYSPFMYFQY